MTTAFGTSKLAACASISAMTVNGTTGNPFRRLGSRLRRCAAHPAVWCSRPRGHPEPRSSGSTPAPAPAPVVRSCPAKVQPPEFRPLESGGKGEVSDSTRSSPKGGHVGSHDLPLGLQERVHRTQMFQDHRILSRRFEGIQRPIRLLVSVGMSVGRRPGRLDRFIVGRSRTVLMGCLSFRGFAKSRDQSGAKGGARENRPRAKVPTEASAGRDRGRPRRVGVAHRVDWSATGPLAA